MLSENIKKLDVFKPSFTNSIITLGIRVTSEPAITCSELTMETLEQGVNYVQS